MRKRECAKNAIQLYKDECMTMTDLHTVFNTEGKKKIQNDLKIKNVMDVPHLVKIAINCGLGEALTNKKVIEVVSSQLSTITGQKPIITHAKRDISTFKLRKGDAVGVKVTLRGKKMYDFFERLVSIVLPRIRDFRGVQDKGLDGRGGFTLGLAEQIIFPEIEYSQVDKIRGFEITFVTTGKDKEATKKLLEILGMPFQKSEARSGKSD